MIGTGVVEAFGAGILVGAVLQWLIAAACRAVRKV